MPIIIVIGEKPDMGVERLKNDGQSAKLAMLEKGELPANSSSVNSLSDRSTIEPPVILPKTKESFFQTSGLWGKRGKTPKIYLAEASEGQGEGALNQMRLNPPKTRNELCNQLIRLRELLSEATKQGNTKFARECQILGMELALFAERKMSAYKHEDIKACTEALGIYIPNKRTLFAKAKRAIKYSQSHPVGATSKFFKSIWKTVVGSTDYRNKALMISHPDEQKLGHGIQYSRISLEEDSPIGEMFKVPPNAKLVFSYDVRTPGSREHAVDDKADRSLLVTSSASYIDFTYAEGVRPTALAIVRGKPYNLRIASDSDGLVMIKNGKVSIEKINDNWKALINSSLSDPNQSIFQSNLLVHNGRNIISRDKAKNDVDHRRVLVTFKDKSCAIVSFQYSLTFYELGTLVASLPNVDSAVNLDTGGGSYGGYYDAGRKFHFFPLATDNQGISINIRTKD